MADLLSLADAKAHLRIPQSDADHNADVATKVSQASAMVLEYLGDAADATWTSVDVPAQVQAATMTLLGHLYENRGDDMKTDEILWESLHRYLVRIRGCVVA